MAGYLLDITCVFQSSNLKVYMHPYFHCSAIYNSQGLEAAQVPTVDEWVKKLWYIYTMEYYLAIKRRKSYLL